MTAISSDVWQGTVSVVVPTYNERDNVRPLLRRLDAVLAPERAEVIIVDDSSDGTAAEVLLAALETAVPVRLLHRLPHERAGGLGGAVVVGLTAATGDWVVVMDGDLQHPPETVPAILAATAHGDAVVASRFVPGGTAEGLAGASRRVGSSGAALLARLLFPQALRRCTDPMSGFFAVRRAALEGIELRPDGFKILLEILARAGALRVQEVPFTFAAREAGESKVDVRQGLVYLRHLLRLRLRTTGLPARLLGFGLIGVSGLIPHLATMVLLQRAGVHYLPATVVAATAAVCWIFALNDGLVYRGRRHGHWWQRFAAFLVLNLVDLAVRLPLMALLVAGLRMDVLVATLVSTGVIFVARFAVVDRLVYARRRAVRERQGALGRAADPVEDVRDAA